jgi:hydroxymethylglutaryl-CoA synthase
MTVPIITSTLDTELPRPKDVGVLAMEVYFPRRVC